MLNIYKRPLGLYGFGLPYIVCWPAVFNVLAYCFLCIGLPFLMCWHIVLCVGLPFLMCWHVVLLCVGMPFSASPFQGEGGLYPRRCGASCAFQPCLPAASRPFPPFEIGIFPSKNRRYPLEK
jgi:hypothetical protein